MVRESDMDTDVGTVGYGRRNEGVNDSRIGDWVRVLVFQSGARHFEGETGCRTVRFLNAGEARLADARGLVGVRTDPIPPVDFDAAMLNRSRSNAWPPLRDRRRRCFRTVRYGTPQCRCRRCGTRKWWRAKVRIRDPASRGKPV